MDSNGDGLTDRIYVGDTGGQLWRIDLPPNIDSSNKGTIALLASLGGTCPSCGRRFFYPPTVVQLKDSKYTSAGNSKYDVVVIGSGHRPNPLGTDVQDRLYVIRDRAINGLVDANNDGVADASPLTHSDLYDATDNLIQDGTTADKIVARIVLKGKQGWYIDLEGTGEKSLSAPTVVQGVGYFTTYTPATSTSSTSCAPPEPGEGRIYALDLLTGGAVNASYDGDSNDTGKDDRSKEIGKGVPSKVVPVVIKDKVVLLTGVDGGVHSENAPSPESSKILYWVKE